MTIQEQLAMRSQGHNISTRFTADGIGTQPVVVSFAGAETTIWEMGQPTVKDLGNDHRRKRNYFGSMKYQK